MNLICLVKGCGIASTPKGYVVCPSCGVNYCWDKQKGPWQNWPWRRVSDQYPFGNWIVCTHDSTCKNRRLHKNRADVLAAGFVKEHERLGTRCGRYKPKDGSSSEEA